MGTPRKYTQEITDNLPSMFAAGESVAEVCQQIGVSRRAFYDWVEKYPEFAEAYECGRLASEAWWNKLGRAGAAGKVDIQPTVWIFNMKNRFDWRDKTENNHTSADGTMSPHSVIEYKITDE